MRGRRSRPENESAPGVSSRPPRIQSPMQELPKNWSITMSSVNEINQRHPSVEPPGVKSPLRHDSVTIACPVCGSSFSPSGRRTYCSDACRANAYRRRRSSGTLPTLRVPRSQPRRENNAARSVTPSCDESESVGIAPRVRRASQSANSSALGSSSNPSHER